MWLKGDVGIPVAERCRGGGSTSASRCRIPLANSGCAHSGMRADPPPPRGQSHARASDRKRGASRTGRRAITNQPGCRFMRSADSARRDLHVGLVPGHPSELRPQGSVCCAMYGRAASRMELIVAAGGGGRYHTRHHYPACWSRQARPADGGSRSALMQLQGRHKKKKSWGGVALLVRRALLAGRAGATARRILSVQLRLPSAFSALPTSECLGCGIRALRTPRRRTRIGPFCGITQLRPTLSAGDVRARIAAWEGPRLRSFRPIPPISNMA
jgi:hypothetical protein